MTAALDINLTKESSVEDILAYVNAASAVKPALPSILPCESLFEPTPVREAGSPLLQSYLIWT